LTSVAHIDQGHPRGFTITRGGGERVFRAAKRHSRRVRLLRMAIPALVVLGFGLFMFAGKFDPLRMLTKLPVDFGNLVVSGTKITMQQPRMAGFTRDARPYELTARAAAQDITKPDKLELQDVHATTEMQDKSVLDVSAHAGVYDNKTDMLILRQDVVFKMSSGIEVFLSEALIDIHKSNVLSEKPVVVKLTQGTIEANRMEVVESGSLIRFGNGVTMNLPPGNGLFTSNRVAGAP
jgi:lipopolysaccharide export system protein LptC